MKLVELGSVSSFILIMSCQSICMRQLHWHLFWKYHRGLHLGPLRERGGGGWGWEGDKQWKRAGNFKSMKVLSISCEVCVMHFMAPLFAMLYVGVGLHKYACDDGAMGLIS